MTRFLLLFGLLSCVAGAALLGTNAYLSRANLWAPLTLPLPRQAGESVSGDFLSQLGGWLELEIELPLAAPLAKEDIPVLSTGVGKVAIDWEIRSDGKVVAQGDADTPLYWESRFSSLRSRLLGTVYGSPLMRDRSAGNLFGLLTSPVAVSGIGRFRAETGGRYKLVLRVNELGPVALASEPLLRVRVRRQTWEQARSESMAFGYAAKYVLATALPALGLGFLLFLKGRRHPA